MYISLQREMHIEATGTREGMQLHSVAAWYTDPVANLGRCCDIYESNN